MNIITSLRSRFALLALLTLVMLFISFSQPIPILGQATNTALPVYAEAIQSANVRTGPGLEYPIIGQIQAGTAYRVIGRSAYYPWYLIIAPNSIAWVYKDLVRISGDMNSVPYSNTIVVPLPTATFTALPPTATPFTGLVPPTREPGLPTYTPNVQAQQVIVIPQVVTGMPPLEATPVLGFNTVLNTLGMDLYNYLMSQNFKPNSDRQASVFVMNLQTGQSITVNPNYAYTAASVMKIPVYLSLYRKLNAPPDPDMAWLIVSMMVCSENSSSNKLLGFLGDGDLERGINYVNETMYLLGMRTSYLGRAFVLNPQATPTPFPSSTPPLSINNMMNFHSTSADRLNYTTPNDMGFLMAGIYQCARDGVSPLQNALGGSVTQQECQHMLQTMAGDQDPILLKAGLPTNEPSVQLIHKRGIVADSNGDAAIIKSLGGDYVLVIFMYQRGYLRLDASTMVSGEISRRVYNVFNVARANQELHAGNIPQCAVSSDLVTRLQKEQVFN